MSEAPASSRATGRGKSENGNKNVTATSRRREIFGRVHPWVTLAFRLLLAGVLGVAGLLKVGDPLASVRAVRAYQLLPESLVTVVGYGLPFLEIALAVLLLLGLAVRFTGVASALVMVAFIIGIASVWARGLSIDCGCFGGGGQVEPSKTQYPLEILRDLGLVVAGAWLFVFPSGRFALDKLVLGEPDDTGKQ